jgi:DNA processing protein
VHPDAPDVAALAPGAPLGRLRHLPGSVSAVAPWTRLKVTSTRAVASGAPNVESVRTVHRRLGIEVLAAGDERFPLSLAEDPSAPSLLFVRGDPAALERRPRVAVVGTRRATRYGLGLAAQLGADLSSSGVVVVTGVAPGVEGAAHEGAAAALRADPHGAAPTVGVVAGGLDGPHHPSRQRLWDTAAWAGILLSATAVGSPVPRWRLAQRQGLLAAMADVVVVVECHVRGAALETARAAAARGVPVGAVPGSVRSPASAGTNDLLADGCFVVRDVADVLVAVGLVRAGEEPRAGGTPSAD